ncbi:MAG: hypothetical protein P0S95_01105 [Rhabdochlamydiaceae bacterium]|nr:hypothetical protein [Candidatus Amphrikana amoebophyrae]
MNNKEDENKQLRSRVAALESKIDLLETEFVYLNQILVECGFPGGIATLKNTVEEVLNENAETSFESARYIENDDEDLV